MKNTGKPSQKAFEAKVARLGKSAFLHRLPDAAEVRGQTGVAGFARKQPADYVLSWGNETSYVDVKSTHDPVAFRFSLLSKSQANFAKRIIDAGGLFEIAVHHLPKGQWYLIDLRKIDLDVVKSIKWQDMVEHLWML
jgi:penicillin-binding protein-related factor A (putative recombinase)